MGFLSERVCERAEPGPRKAVGFGDTLLAWFGTVLLLGGEALVSGLLGATHSKLRGLGGCFKESQV
ncbi:hypothetical protein GCM10009639_66980 [Kitasatospora putterlickiae]|uniref:Uncharacterized protein n=1 Tax=Kitasatospora putterlickiae TaxID=221725 RepID=A0ABN1YH71_9ACTN